MGENGTAETLDVSAAARILEKHGLARGTPAFGPDLARVNELLIPLLQDIQDAYGYLPPSVLEWVSEETGIATSRMYGVITFYSQFYLTPKGRHTVRCCQGTACHVKGGKAVAEALADALGVEDGGTTADKRFTFETVQCLGTCFLAPVVMVDEDYYGEMTQDKVAKTLKRYT